ncbi:hypothetical protein F0L68_18030 [Solihabitans fulvus]|uniref:Uncharacterized protein n=1 Tax=Solihabitans fulvus TaxID=1892852 RepID=A0A5B2XEG7_9PSEU|nr:hypothetical protein [Solihabitans fulvus]KAA2261340.1 hypothetical protein F0L68_18030 [Solihabitans fulvus]
MPTEIERLDAVEPIVAGLVDGHAELVAELYRLTARIAVLERRLAGAGAGPDAGLDASAEEFRSLAQVLRQAWDAEQEVLADSVRDTLRQQVQEWTDLRARRADVQDRLASGKVARIERGRFEHDVHQLDWQIGARETAAQEAAGRLDADREAVEETWRQEAMRAGDKARGELVEVARTRVGRALAVDERMPVWFTVGLGEITAPDPTCWLDAATDLLAYRIEYGVTDPVNPLGDRPSDQSGSAAWIRRCEVFADLADRLHALRP